jgi:cell division protein FtsQ
MNSALSSRPQPLDVRLMNKASAALFTVAVVGALAVGAWWVLHHPSWAVTRIAVTGDLTHNNAVTFRANVAPKLSGNFYTLDLKRVRAAFEAVPWVRSAVVRRVFPDQLTVSLQEHQAVAYWGTDAESRLLNSFGEVFEANAGDIEQDNLPRLHGPDPLSAQVLAMYRTLQAPFALLDTELEVLQLSSRGGWRAQLANGALLELGSGNTEEVLARTLRFVRTLTQISSRYGRRVDAVMAADLRYPQGYALRLRGVGTLNMDTPDTAPVKR